MFSLLSFILTVYLIVFADILLGQTEEEAAACKAKVAPDIASSITLPLTIKLYYHVGIEPDITYLKSMCAAMIQFCEEVTFTFVPGDWVKEGPNGPLCITPNLERTPDCTGNIIHVCASKLVNFNDWIDCVVCQGKEPIKCISAQDESKVEEFNQCVGLNHPTINPCEIFRSTAKESDPLSRYKPLILYSGKIDMCANVWFYDDPIKLVNTLLKANSN